MPILGCPRCGARRQVPGWGARQEACACGGRLTLAAGATQELEPPARRAAFLARAGLGRPVARADDLEGTIDDGGVLPLPGAGGDPDRTSDEERILPLPPAAGTAATFEDARVLEVPRGRAPTVAATLEDARVLEVPRGLAPDATVGDAVVLVPPGAPALGATQEDARVMPIPDESRQASAVAPPPRRTAHELPAAAPVVLPAPALRVGGYELRESIGHGGFAAVYRAWDPRHEREVAVKLLERLDPRARERFQRELLATARLRHPNIVSLLDSGKDERGRPFLVLELVRGQTLSEAWRGPCRTSADVAERVRTVKDLARALEHSHASGVLHRDVKPENVLLDEGGRARLIDLGLARIGGAEGLTQEGEAYGTPAYMSPEQAGSGDAVDGRSDVYSLGATLYRGLTGRPPFGGAGAELFLAIFRDDPAPPGALAPIVPAELSAICLRCLEKDPERRFAAMSELGDELERWLAGAPLATRPPGRLARLRRGVERHLAPTAAAAIGLLLGVVGSQVLLSLLPERAQVASTGGRAPPAAELRPVEPAPPPPPPTSSHRSPAKAELAKERAEVELPRFEEEQRAPRSRAPEAGPGELEGLRFVVNGVATIETDLAAGGSFDPYFAAPGSPSGGMPVERRRSGIEPAEPAPPPVEPAPPPVEPPVEPEPAPVESPAAGGRRATAPPPAPAGVAEEVLLPLGLGVGLAFLALLGTRALLRRQLRSSAELALARWQAGRLGTEATEAVEPPSG